MTAHLVTPTPNLQLSHSRNGISAVTVAAALVPRFTRVDGWMDGERDVVMMTRGEVWTREANSLL